MYAVFMLLAASAYGLVSPILRLAYGAGLSAAATTDGQYAVAAVVLWVFALFCHKGKRINRIQWLLIVAIGLMNAVFSYAYYRALTVLPASLGVVFMFQFVWMTMFIDIAVKRRLPGLWKWIGLVLILLGTYFAVGVSVGAWRAMPMWAVGLGLVSAFAYAVSLYLSGYNDPAVAPQLRAALVITVAWIAVSFPFPPSMLWHSFRLHPLPTLYWGFWIALLSQILPTLLSLIAIPHIGGRMAGVLGTMELPVAVFGAWLINGDVVGPVRWLGVTMILAGIVVSEAIGRKEASM
ncbi:threonine/homoserine efflux transporter RhtA [Alicyclobacillus sacchari]|uniref:Threonine/homoserine efflux transporter RhtA n=1 Tax=Alicyclobacillus sacchari TaxID=392010 RepID=A0A4R8LQW6_9BACL|nr:threonine/homoserine efflux transporter RhtA [Alicyclobacillus sacchari]GMA57736.1 multidrug transporter [Alicyclobacillus sacchari]